MFVLTGKSLQCLSNQLFVLRTSKFQPLGKKPFSFRQLSLGNEQTSRAQYYSFSNSCFSHISSTPFQLPVIYLVFLRQKSLQSLFFTSLTQVSRYYQPLVLISRLTCLLQLSSSSRIRLLLLSLSNSPMQQIIRWRSYNLKSIIASQRSCQSSMLSAGSQSDLAALIVLFIRILILSYVLVREVAKQSLQVVYTSSRISNLAQ